MFNLFKYAQNQSTLTEDEKYLEAVKRKDMSTAQQMVDDAAKKAGYNIGPVYHGTNAKFNQFSMDYFGRTDDGFFGKGFYFTPSEEGSKEYGEPKSVYLRIKNPLRLPSAGSMGHKSVNTARDILAKVYDVPELSTKRTLPDGYIIKEREKEAYGKTYKLYTVYPDEKYYGTDKELYGPEGDSEEEAIILFNDMVNDININAGWLSDMLKYFNRDSLLDVAKSKGYDGIIIEDAEFDVGTIDEIIVDNPNQIKLTSPVTYDDNGKIIPLSKRFDSNSPDLRSNNISVIKYAQNQSLIESFLNQFKPQSLKGLAAEALKVDSAKEFEKDFIIQIKHGSYWHITEDPNFQIDLNKGPSDMSSMARGEMRKGSLMVTYHLTYWLENYKGLRAYVAEIDMSNVPRKEFYQVNRGFGNEFWVKDASKAKVLRVLPIKEALRLDRYRHSKIPQSYEELEYFYNKVHKEYQEFVERNNNTKI